MSEVVEPDKRAALLTESRRVREKAFRLRLEIVKVARQLKTLREDAEILDLCADVLDARIGGYNDAG